MSKHNPQLRKAIEDSTQITIEVEKKHLQAELTRLKKTSLFPIDQRPSQNDSKIMVLTVLYLDGYHWVD